MLRLQPKLATFDCDGTLWSGDAGESFFWWELENGLVSEEITRWARARYADYKAGKVSETTMCGEMVTLHKGLPEARIQEATDSFFEANLASGIFPEMQALVRRLRKAVARFGPSRRAINGSSGPRFRTLELGATSF